MCGVYMITCIPTGEFYIGGTTLTFDLRFVHHRNALRSGVNKVRLLQAAWNTYGEEAFEFRILKSFPPEEVARREGEAIDRLNPPLNIYRRTGHYQLSKQTGIGVKTLEYRAKHGLSLTEPPILTQVIDEENLTLKQISKKYNISLQTLYYRYNKGLRGVKLLMASRQGSRI